MTPNDYLQQTLEGQNLEEDSDELKTLRRRRDEVEKHLRETFGSKPTIRYGGSKAKGTLIKEVYDLDIICYFARDDDDAGLTLEEIFENAKMALLKKYVVIPKTSALRLQSQSHEEYHVDVVPGRFVDETKSDAFLHRTTGSKERLKTNLQKHIDYVKGSGVVPAIRLTKLWRVRNGLSITHFPLELMVIEILKNRKSSNLDVQLKHVWTTLRDDVNAIKIEDPANPYGNDLNEALNDSIRSELSSAARRTLSDIDSRGWEAVFGALPAQDVRSALREAAKSVSSPARPWAKTRKTRK